MTIKIKEQYKSLFDLAMSDLNLAERVLENNGFYVCDEDFIRTCFDFLRLHIHEVIWYNAEINCGDD